MVLTGLLACAPAYAQPVPQQQVPGGPPPRGLMPRQSEVMPGPGTGGAPGADMPGADPLQVLANSFQVQRDLGLNQHQLENLQLASRNFLTQMQELLPKLSSMPPEQARAVMDDQMGKTRLMINRELTPEQLGRFQQILLQIQGPCAMVADPAAGQQLAFSGQQQRQIGAVCQARDMQMRAAFQPPGPGQNPCDAAAGNRDRLMAVRRDGDRQVLAVFTPEQRAQFVRMQGRLLDLEPPMPPNCAMPGGPTPPR